MPRSAIFPCCGAGRFPIRPSGAARHGPEAVVSDAVPASGAFPRDGCEAAAGQAGAAAEKITGILFAVPADFR